jgi:hypothetical protein
MSDGRSYQFISAAPDGMLAVWDIRFEDRSGAGGRRASMPTTVPAATPMVPTASTGASQPAPTEIAWTPTYRVVIKSGGQGRCGIVRFALSNEVGLW